MFYATLDFDGERIERDAHIVKFDTLKDAETYLRSAYPAESGWDQASIEITAGQFSDCWQKTTAFPKMEYLRPFSLTQIRVERPGEHPGGKMFWATPKVDVLVVSNVREE